jgi:hypothetical protein
VPDPDSNCSKGINIDSLPVGLRNRVYSGDGSRSNPIRSESFTYLSQFLQFLGDVVKSVDADVVYGNFNDLLYEYQKNDQITKFSDKADKVVFPIFPSTEQSRIREDYFTYLGDASDYIVSGEGTVDNPYIAATALDKFIITLESLARHSIRTAVYGLFEDELFKVTQDGAICPILSEKDENVLLSKIKYFENKVYEKVAQLHLVLHQLCPLEEETGIPKNGKAFMTTVSSPKKTFSLYYTETDLWKVMNNIAREIAGFEKRHPAGDGEKQRLLSSTKKNNEKLEIELYEDCLINDIDRMLQEIEGLIKKYPDLGSEYVDIEWKEKTKTLALEGILEEAKQMITMVRNAAA